MAWLHKAMLVNLIIRGVINDELHSKRSKSRCGGVYTLRQQNLAGDYDLDKTQTALSKTQNITAYDGKTLVGVLRILTDGYFFGTITELLVHPEYQNRGIGSRLLQLAKDNTPTMLYFGAQPGLETFYEKNGCQKACSPT